MKGKFRAIDWWVEHNNLYLKMNNTGDIISITLNYTSYREFTGVSFQIEPRKEC